MMKRFKFGLVGILFGLFGFINFSNGMIVEDLIQKICPASNPDCNYTLEDITVSNSYTVLYDFGENYNVVGNVVCLRLSNFSTTSISDVFLGFSANTNNSLPYNSIQFSNNFPYQFECIYAEGGYLKGGVKAGASPITFDLELFVLDDLLSTSIPEKTSQECQNEYNLIPIEDIDINYCVENDLCPVASNFSQLFINEIEHQSAPLINITIPEEYNWDSSVNSGQFDLTISGYNVDYEYIDGVIRTQKFTPDEEDFNNIITQVIPLLVPGLVIILFIWFIFRFIKKIF